MEQELRNHMLALANAYMAATGKPITTVGFIAAGDTSYFQRLKKARTTFTVKKYDDVVGWFRENWPENARWPDWPASASVKCA